MALPVTKWHNLHIRAEYLLALVQLEIPYLITVVAASLMSSAVVEMFDVVVSFTSKETRLCRFPRILKTVFSYAS